MEEIYKPKNTKIISVKDALLEYQSELLPAGLATVPTSEGDIAAAMSFNGSEHQFNELLQSVDLDRNLSSIKDFRITNFHPARLQNVMKPVEITEKALRFNCVQNAIKITGRLRKNLDCRIRYNKHKYTFIPRREETDLYPFSEMVLEIRFYEPFKYKTGVRLGHPKFHQEFYVLGSQTLTELRDKIYCQCDLVGGRSRSGLFFIHDTFYNDMRKPANMDYSEVIQTWAKRQKSIGELKTKLMEEAKFEDLQFRLGYPQVYQHHGNCEHIFVISNCRLLASSDLLVRRRYPILNSYAFPRSIPFCYESYHYRDGVKIGQFEAFRFLGTKIAVKDDDVEMDVRL
ncbi:hypothetical protein quinque_002140 [Culex quinquefasciatus]